MKISFVLMFVCIIQISASTFSQSSKLDLLVSDMKVKDVLKLIESKSNYRFFYNNDLTELDKTLSLAVKGESVDDLLKDIFSGSSVSFKVFENHVVVIAPAVSLQQMQITGTVTDASSGEPLVGVSIIVEGISKGTVTDMNGKYTLEVPSGNSVLVFSYLGYNSERVSVNNLSVIDVKLVPDIKSLDEVVVIGYGTVKKRDLTGAVSSVKAADIVQSPTGNVMEAIQGKVAGVDILRNSGAAGSDVMIKIRGNRSIGNTKISSGTGSFDEVNRPLIIIDGVQGGSLTDLNANDIESIDILKDASTTAIYGWQGANGVIIITTKAAKAGKTRISYNGYYGVNGLTPYPKGRMGEDYIAMRRAAFKNSGAYIDDQSMFSVAEWNAIQAGQWVDWTNLMLSNGTLQNHQISVSGGNEKTKSYLSAGYYNEVGPIKDNYSRYNLRLNLDHNFNKWIKSGVMSQITYVDQNKRSDAFGKANSSVPLGTPYDENGNILIYPFNNDISVLSPLTDLRANAAVDNYRSTRFQTLGYVELTPVKGLSYRSNLGVNLQYNREGTFNDMYSMAQINTKRNEATVTSSNNLYINWDNIVTYNKEFGSHSFTATAITSYTKNDFENFYIDGINQQTPSTLYFKLEGTDPASRILNSLFRRAETMSYAGRINYSFRGKYLLTATERFDGSTRLSPGNQWNSFPSVAVAWRISEENFLKNLTFLNNLKFRLSYGEAGNAFVPEYSIKSALNPANLTLGDESTPAKGYTFRDIIGNPNLTWEKSKTANVGIDLGLFRDRINATVDMYRTRTEGVLYLRPLPMSAGGMSNDKTTFSIWQNVGETENKGIEFSLNTVNVQSREFKWSSSFTFSRNKEKIIDLINGKDIIVDETKSLLLGRPIHTFFTYQKLGIWQISDSLAMRAMKTPYKPGDIRVADINGDSIIDTKDRTYIGSTSPDWSAGFQNTFSYKGFDLGVYLFARWGQMINDDLLGRFNPPGTGNGPAFINYWTPENPTNDFPRPMMGYKITDYTGYQTLYYVDGSYFKIKNITLGYTLPKNFTRKLFISSFRIYATVSNILTIANNHLVKNYDPENSGSEKAPMSKQVVFGVNLDF